MANLDFFGARDDLAAVLKFLFSSTDFHVFDSYSPYGEQLHEFHSIDEVEEHHSMGIERYGNGFAVLL